MKYFMLFAALVFSINVSAQTAPPGVSEPQHIVITSKKGEIIFTDQRLHRVIKVANGKVSTLAGNNIIDPCSQNIAGRAQEGYKDGKAPTALFNFPKGIAYDSKGNLFIE